MYSTSITVLNVYLKLLLYSAEKVFKSTRSEKVSTKKTIYVIRDKSVPEGRFIKNESNPNKTTLRQGQFEIIFYH